jgi:hypothetical protein
MSKEEFKELFPQNTVITLPTLYVDYVTVLHFGRNNFIGITPDGEEEIFSYEKEWVLYEA